MHFAEHSLQYCFSELEVSITGRVLVLNAEKTKFILFSRAILNNLKSFILAPKGYTTIERVTVHKYLDFFEVTFHIWPVMVDFSLRLNTTFLQTVKKNWFGQPFYWCFIIGTFCTGVLQLQPYNHLLQFCILQLDLQLMIPIIASCTKWWENPFSLSVKSVYLLTTYWDATSLNFLCTLKVIRVHSELGRSCFVFFALTA